MYCNCHKEDPATNTCDLCGEEICDLCYERYEIPDEGWHLCNSCFVKVANERIAYGNSERKKTIRKLIFSAIGFIIGLILGLDICFGFGILVHEPTNLWIAVVFLPFIVPSIFNLVTGGIDMYKKDRDKSGSDFSAGWNFLLIIIILFKATVASPIVFFQTLALRISNLKKANEVMKLYAEFRRIAIDQANTEK